MISLVLIFSIKLFCVCEWTNELFLRNGLFSSSSSSFYALSLASSFIGIKICFRNKEIGRCWWRQNFILYFASILAPCRRKNHDYQIGWTTSSEKHQTNQKKLVVQISFSKYLWGIYKTIGQQMSLICSSLLPRCANKKF